MSHITSKHLVIISVDALNKYDLPILKSLPTFNSFLEEGAYVKDVKGVYPSLTYTSHTSIITGTFPDKHGIHANEKPTPEACEKQPWYWYESDIKVPTLFDYATKAGMTTGNVLWPVMTDAPIHYNIPEIWSVTGRSYTRELLSHIKKNVLFTILKNAGKADGSKQPNLDDFTESCATQIMLRKKPNLMTLHLLELDQERHVTGLMDPRKDMVLKRMDQRIGRLIEATKKAGYFDQTTFVILGDHGGTNHQQLIYLNTYFRDNKMITINPQGKISSWIMYANGCGGSVQISINPQATDVERQLAIDLLGKIVCQPNSMIKNMYDQETLSTKFRLKGPFDYVLEAKEGYIFRSSLTDSMVKHRASVTDSYKLEHGHDPNHPDLRTLFMAKGPSIRKGVVLEESCIVDDGPTMARILGLNMEQVDGKVLEDFFYS